MMFNKNCYLTHVVLFIIVVVLLYLFCVLVGNIFLCYVAGVEPSWSGVVHVMDETADFVQLMVRLVKKGA
jgi:hypothetical protein